MFERVNPACDDVGMAPDGMNERLRRGISFGNALDTDRWDFGTDFGAFDPRRDAWREPMLDALLPP